MVTTGGVAGGEVLPRLVLFAGERALQDPGAGRRRHGRLQDHIGHLELLRRAAGAEREQEKDPEIESFNDVITTA